jgi:hypothetical protein
MESKRVMLSEILPIPNVKDYKIHFARWNKLHQPLDVFTRDRNEWQGWSAYWPNRNDFNRPLIFSLADFYHETDVWLFGGIYEVLALRRKRYELRLSGLAAGLIGRLKLYYRYRDRGTRVNLENHYSKFEVSEVLREQYSGRAFPGYENVNLSFDEIEALVRNGRPDWKVALENIKGVYLITDARTGKRYVGAAYGQTGIWCRWSAYAKTGHGGNVELRDVVRKKGLPYCRANFRFALLDQRPLRMPDEELRARESYWKKLLLTRGDWGFNRN